MEETNKVRETEEEQEVSKKKESNTKTARMNVSTAELVTLLSLGHRRNTRCLIITTANRAVA